MSSRDSQGADMGAWDDPMFTNTTFDEAMATDSPNFDLAMNNFTNFSDAYDDMSGLNMRTPSKTGWDVSTPAQQAPPMSALVGASNESSSQDSASDSSSRRKRKVTESPMSDGGTELAVKKEESIVDMGGMEKVQSYDRVPTRPMHNLSLDADVALDSQYDFNSAASSPVAPRAYNLGDFTTQAARISSTMVTDRFHPASTINPGVFDPTVGGDSMLLSGPSPNAIHSTPSSESNDLFNAGSMWNNLGASNPLWPSDPTAAAPFASPGNFRFPHSPSANGATPSAPSRGSISQAGLSPLHIGPIVTKSRVETQIMVTMTLEKPPAGIECLHLPLHTIAKSKLLAKEPVDASKVLELHVCLVCTSAMQNPQLKERALKRAAAQSNAAIQRRAELARDLPDEDKNDMKNVDEVEKPLNGGEVRICANCIQRERKRAGRKKLRKEEEQLHWERFETERVVVFNSPEYLPFQSPEQHARESSTSSDDQAYTPPPGSVQVSAAMRIACYCRHQSEKEGFRVIFTMKDQHGNVVAQQMSDSILITDDHKTHPQTYPAGIASEVYYPNNPNYNPNGLPSSYSMQDLTQHANNFPSSRSMTNLSAYGQQYHAHSHVHQMPSAHSGYSSQATSATMTPTSMSRPASPTSANHVGPNKKRKSSGSTHRKVPSGLQMTPRVDTNQPPSSNLPSAVSLTSPFSPSADGYAAQSYMTIPNHGGPAQYYGSGPPTPNESLPQSGFTEAQFHNHFARSHNAQAYFSHPSSTVPSRAASPVLRASRPNPNLYARQPSSTHTATLQNTQQQQQHQQQLYLAQPDHEQQASVPTITKITPIEGPIMGGTEVSVYGFNFANGSTVMFGDNPSITTYYGPQALLAVTPPSRPGGVHVSVRPPSGTAQMSGQSTYMTSSAAAGMGGSGRQIFTYSDRDPKLMENALRQYSVQQNGSPVHWQQEAVMLARQYVGGGGGAAASHHQQGQQQQQMDYGQGY